MHPLDVSEVSPTFFIVFFLSEIAWKFVITNLKLSFPHFRILILRKFQYKNIQNGLVPGEFFAGGLFYGTFFVV
jgi:hypothetical protein